MTDLNLKARVWLCGATDPLVYDDVWSADIADSGILMLQSRDRGGMRVVAAFNAEQWRRVETERYPSETDGD